MKFKVNSLRVLNKSSADLKYCIFNETSPLIHITSKWDINYYQSKREKKDFIVNVDWDKDVVLFVWAWQWRSDVFNFSKEDIDLLLNK